jgi:hypothetical protein
MAVFFALLIKRTLLDRLGPRGELLMAEGNTHSSSGQMRSTPAHLQAR